MIDKENRIELFDGRKTRWVRPDEVGEFKARGFWLVSQPDDPEIKVTLKSVKIAKQVVESTETTIKPTTEE